MQNRAASRKKKLDGVCVLIATLQRSSGFGKLEQGGSLGALCKETKMQRSVSAKSMQQIM